MWIWRARSLKEGVTHSLSLRAGNERAGMVLERGRDRVTHSLALRAGNERAGMVLERGRDPLACASGW